MCDECGTLDNILSQILVLFPKKFECSQVHYKITHSKCDECAFQKLTELVYTHMLFNPTQLTS